MFFFNFLFFFFLLKVKFSYLFFFFGGGGGLSFYFSDQPVLICTNTKQSSSLLLCSTAWDKVRWFPQKVFYWWELVWLFWFFCYSKWRWKLLYLCEKLSWNFVGDCIESVDFIWLDGHFHYVNPIMSMGDHSIFCRLRLLSFKSLRSCHTGLSLPW